ncbi:hypothetical protein [Enterobacter ludwigii]|jgi:hypothetical protein|nr:hypothetical protein [Enterobacter ludwigii]EKS7193713.1 hypothetical protein [Enterobacter ludwigii]EKS7207265.1 hypothetical protein [Enterobacter ludwigii]ELV2797906.1 hypothetical protein [Enterobacter ludwigii]MDR6399215.1 hypothetical protein [Enterobacter ludwigii]MED5736969.1 hypothetical protein [Enterobacter ludwigii]
MKNNYLSMLIGVTLLSMSSLSVASEAGHTSNPGYGDGGTAQKRQIDACVNANTSTVTSYDNVSHVKPCTGGVSYKDRELPAQKIKAPFK